MKIIADHLTKTYNTLRVLENLNLTFTSGRPYCLMGPSGTGKTTLFRLILGLEKPDSGRILLPDGGRLTAVFQEDRLCESFTPIENITMAAPKTLTPSTAASELSRLLPPESLTRPVSTLSGGMKRRTAICRALLAPSDGILMDEPFTGLDEATKHTVIQYILEKTPGKLLLISTHQEADIPLLDATLITLPTTPTITPPTERR